MGKLFSSSNLYLRRKAPTILTCVGAVGVIATSVMAVKATPKAMMLLEQAKEEKGENLTKTEIVKVAAPVYIPSVMIGVGTISCIFGANMLNKRQQASIVSAYALMDQSYKEYRKKVNEIYGSEVEEKVKEEIAKEKYPGDMDEDDGKELFFDNFSGRYFRSTVYKVQQAEYQLNRDLAMRDYAYLNEFYEYLDIPTIEGGWELGWSTGACLDMYWQNWIDFSHSKVILDDGLECRTITIFQEPILGFEDYS